MSLLSRLPETDRQPPDSAPPPRGFPNTVRSGLELAVIGIVAAVCIAMLGAASPPTERYSAFLGPTPLNDATRTKVRGRATATLTLTQSKVTVTGSFSGLVGAATTAELRGGEGVGIAGPIIAPLTITAATSGDFSGAAQLTAAQVKALRRGYLYVQINSQSAPAPIGNLWGWVLSSAMTLPGTNPPADL